MAFTDPKLQAPQKAAEAAQAQAQAPRAIVESEIEVFDYAFSANEVMVVLLFLIVGFLVYHAWKAQRDRPNFNIIDLVLDETGRILPERFIVMVAFGLHSWTITKWIITGVVSTADFASYGAIWVAPLVVSLLRGRNGAQSAPNTANTAAQPTTEAAAAVNGPGQVSATLTSTR